jgi:Secretion system C-terminal sorting domain/Domain of unknown function (DUF4397)
MKKLIFTSLFAFSAVLSQAQDAYYQIIHNCADAAAATVDVWINNAKAYDNVAFRTATSFDTTTAGVPIVVSICGGNSTDTIGAVRTFTVTLTANTAYVIVADGIVSSTGYSPVQPFDLKIYSGARQAATMATNTDVLVHHGCTDAPMVDVREASAGTVLVNDASYGDFAGYLSLPVADYNINITDAAGANVVASYQAPLATLGLGGRSLTVLASGFLNPAMNSNGAAFGLWVATAAGGALIPLPLATSINRTSEVSEMQVFPNPAQNNINLSFKAEQNTDVAVQITDALGQLVYEQQLGNIYGQQNIQIATQNIPNGIYNLSLRSSKGVKTSRLLIQK